MMMIYLIEFGAYWEETGVSELLFLKFAHSQIKFNIKPVPLNKKCC